MFTGLIDDVGTIVSVADTDAGREFRISCGYRDLVDGDSEEAFAGLETLTVAVRHRFVARAHGAHGVSERRVRQHHADDRFAIRCRRRERRRPSPPGPARR